MHRQRSSRSFAHWVRKREAERFCGAHRAKRFVFQQQERHQFAVAASRLQRLIAQIWIPFRGQVEFCLLQSEIGKRRAFPDFAVMQLIAPGLADFPALPRLTVFEWKHRGAKIPIASCPPLMRGTKLNQRAVIAPPAVKECKHGAQAFPVSLAVVMDRQRKAGIAGCGDRLGQAGVPVQEEAVCHDAYVRLRPMPSDQRDEFAKPRMDSRLAAKQIELLDGYPAAPLRHPAIGFREVEISPMPMIGIMRAAFAGQVAGVRHMQFQRSTVGRPTRTLSVRRAVLKTLLASATTKSDTPM